MVRSVHKASMFFLASLLAVAPLAAGDERKGMTIDIENDEGENISITISSNMVDGIIKGLAENDINCDDSDLDPETQKMLEHLDRKGEGSKYSFTNEEGQLVKARRRKGQWEMTVVKDGEKDTVISMPWGMAECMLGRDVPAYRGKDDLEFKIEQDGGVSIRIE
jgi:hypothetical protein